jgi:2-oxoisovalerate dehydrogenase E2 component (dihydrolipoyl transacylase)
VELLQWYVGKGEKIAQFDRVCEVQSDKATVEITSRYDGVVESLCGEIGDMIDVGSPLLHISIVDTEAQPEERHSSIQPHLSVLHRINDEPDKLLIPPGRGMTRDLSVSAISTSTLQNKVKSTPAVRKIGKENGLDLGTVKGTGPKGRILKSDVLQLINEKTQLSVNDGIMSLASTRRYAPCLSSHEDETVPIRGFNRLMCKTMTASLQIPHMCYADEINMNAVLKCRKDLQSTAERHGVKLSLLAFAIKAASLAMKEYRIMNSSLDADEYMLTYKANHNIGVAMDTPRGLVVPVIKSCQNLSIFEIARELERLKQSVSNDFAHNGQLVCMTSTLKHYVPFCKSSICLGI